MEKTIEERIQAAANDIRMFGPDGANMYAMEKLVQEWNELMAMEEIELD